MGLPLIFHQAGIIPTCVCLILVGCCSAMCGCLLSESLSMLPNNTTYKRNISFPSLVRIVIGRKMFILAMGVVVCTSMLQCVTNVVEASKALDMFWVNFIHSHSYGVVFDMGLVPIEPSESESGSGLWGSELGWDSASVSIGLDSWSPESCPVISPPIPNPLYASYTQSQSQQHEYEHEYEYDRILPVCLPYGNQGPYVGVLSIGYGFMVLALLPMGLRTISQTIPYQQVSFLLLVVLSLLLICELFNQHRGSYHIHHSSSLFGSHYGNLLGVVLYNYAYTVIVPTWLHLKQESVGVNSTIWGAVGFATCIYITFGMYVWYCVWVVMCVYVLCVFVCIACQYTNNYIYNHLYRLVGFC